jgi:hypothetical protein
MMKSSPEKRMIPLRATEGGSPPEMETDVDDVDEVDEVDDVDEADVIESDDFFEESVDGFDALPVFCFS